MAYVIVEVIRVKGTCNAALKEGDSFLLNELQITPQGNANTCQVAFASVVMNAGRLRLQKDPVYVSCPDPGSGEGGNVLFKLSLVEA